MLVVKLRALLGEVSLFPNMKGVDAEWTLSVFSDGEGVERGLKEKALSKDICLSVSGGVKNCSVDVSDPLRSFKDPRELLALPCLCLAVLSRCRDLSMEFSLEDPAEDGLGSGSWGTGSLEKVWGRFEETEPGEL